MLNIQTSEKLLLNFQLALQQFHGPMKKNFMIDNEI